MSKTHFRKVFKSDHLGSADLEEMIEEGRSLIFTIKYVTQHLLEPNNKNSGVLVAGRRISANIAHFEGNIKPMVLNATNSAIVKGFAGGVPWVEDWKNIMVELYIDRNVKMKGEVVGGVRIKEKAPKIYNENEIKVLKGKILSCKDLSELTAIFNSDIAIRTNKDLMTSITQRKNQLIPKTK